MSLWCGACRKEIFEGFGMLYELERIPKRGPRQPEKRPGKEEYVPKNAAICDACWSGVPSTEWGPSSRHLDIGSRTVFAYVPADSDQCLFGSKSWSSVQIDDAKLVSRATVTQYLPRALGIIHPEGGDAPSGKMEIVMSEAFVRALAEERGRTYDDAFIRDLRAEFSGAS